MTLFQKIAIKNRHIAKKCSKIAIFQVGNRHSDIYVVVSISRRSIATSFDWIIKVERESEKLVSFDISKSTIKRG